MVNCFACQPIVDVKYLLNFHSFHNEGGAAAYAIYPVCRGKELTCSNNILNRMGEFNEVQDIIENKTKICLPNCEDQVSQ